MPLSESELVFGFVVGEGAPLDRGVPYRVFQEFASSEMHTPPLLRQEGRLGDDGMPFRGEGVRG